MRYLVVGAGAVGATVAAHLALAGSDVVVSARGAHLAALRTDGLRVRTPRGDLHADVPARATTELAPNPGDVVVLTTKTQDTAAALEALGPLPARVPIVCAQNGVENERIALRRHERVLAMVVNLPATFLEPGLVVAEGAPFPGLLDLGRYPAGPDPDCDRIATDLTRAGFVSEATERVMPAKYGKLLRNLGNALEVLCGPGLGPGGSSSAGAAFELLYRAARDEGRSVLDAAGIEVLGEDEERARRMDRVGIAAVPGHRRQGGSTWQSVVRGTGSVEVDYLNGEVNLLARRLGAPAPVNALLQREVHALLATGRPAGSVGAPALLDRLGLHGDGGPAH